jgi:hypothetical protein
MTISSMPIPAMSTPQLTLRSFSRRITGFTSRCVLRVKSNTSTRRIFLSTSRGITHLRTALLPGPFGSHRPRPYLPIPRMPGPHPFPCQSIRRTCGHCDPIRAKRKCQCDQNRTARLLLVLPAYRAVPAGQEAGQGKGSNKPQTERKNRKC